MTIYDLKLSLEQIKLIKSLLGGDVVEINSKAELKAYHELKNSTFLDVAYQLSDQQNLPAPLSQREYPQ